jgi:hypothetical protein
VRERARGASRRLAWIGAAAVAAGAAVVVVRAESGCATHLCDADCVVRGQAGWPGCASGDPGGDTNFGFAYFVGDSIVWESAPATAGDAGATANISWLDYPGLRKYVLNWASAVNQQLRISTSDLDAQYQVGTVVAYVSTFQQDPVQNFVEASGQLAEITDLSPDHVTITNGSCERYYLRVVVQLLPIGNGGADAGSSDASSQAETAADASVDAADATQDAPRAD